MWGGRIRCYRSCLSSPFVTLSPHSSLHKSRHPLKAYSTDLIKNEKELLRKFSDNTNFAYSRHNMISALRNNLYSPAFVRNRLKNNHCLQLPNCDNPWILEKSTPILPFLILPFDMGIIGTTTTRPPQNRRLNLSYYVLKFVYSLYSIRFWCFFQNYIVTIKMFSL